MKLDPPIYIPPPKKTTLLEHLSDWASLIGIAGMVIIILGMILIFDALLKCAHLKECL